MVLDFRLHKLLCWRCCWLLHKRTHTTFTLLNEFWIFHYNVSVFIFLLPWVPNVLNEVRLDEPSPEKQNYRNNETRHANHLNYRLFVNVIENLLFWLRVPENVTSHALRDER